MEWIVVKPQGSLNSSDRAKAITRELYNITKPVYLQNDSESTATCFEMITHPKDDNQAACRQLRKARRQSLQVAILLHADAVVCVNN